MASSQASGVNTPPYVDLKRAVELMLDGHPVIFPTETFFALGSRALDADATARVYPGQAPLHCPSSALDSG